MKKILTHLTGIVVIITILIAGSCKNQNGKTTEDSGPKQALVDSTKVDIYLKAVLIDGSMHLEMYDSKKPGCEVIDNLVTVYPGYTVKWQEVKDSNIEDVLDIRLVEADSIFSLSKDSIGLMSLFKLEIPKDAKPDTIKYEIVSTVKQGGGTWCIDPYLRIDD